MRIAGPLTIQALALSLLLTAGCNRPATSDDGSFPDPAPAAETVETPTDDSAVASLPEPDEPAAPAPAPIPAPAAKVPTPRSLQPAPPKAVEAPPAARRHEVTIPAGTAFDLEFLDGLSSESSAVGDSFRARVVADIAVDGRTAVRAGSEVSGVVTEARATKKVGGQAQLGLQFSELILSSGERIPIQASLAVSGKKQTKKDAATIGGATAGGAILGRVLDKRDKKRGTLIGAVVGAAAGSAIAANNPEDPVEIDPGTVLGLTFEEPVTLLLEDVR